MHKPRTDLLEPKDVARLLDLSTQRVRQLADAGALRPAIVTRRGARLYEPAEVERLRIARENQGLGKAAA